MRRLPPRSTLTDTLFPDTTLCRSLAADEGDRYARFDVSTYTRSLFNHCDRSLSHAYRLGPHGLPLIGADDWNDGMDRVGSRGHGESVWLAWFIIATIRNFTRH